MEAALAASVRGGFKESSVAGLKPWQVEKVVRAHSEITNVDGRFGVINADKMGYGKTRAGIAVACMARAVRTGGGALIFCSPKRNCEAWVKELNEHTSLRVKVWNDMPESGRAPGALLDGDAVVITHTMLRECFSEIYEKVPVDAFAAKDPDIYARWTEREGAKQSALFHQNSAAFILDESHFFRNEVCPFLKQKPTRSSHPPARPRSGQLARRKP